MKKSRILAAFLLVCAGFLSLALREPEEFTRSGMAMNTIIRMTVYGHDDSPLNDAFSLLDELDRRLSMYNPSSDISRINSGSTFRANTHTVNAIIDAIKLHEITGGVFSPLIGTVTRLWKINQADGKIPSPESLDAAIKLSDIRSLTVSGDTVSLTPGSVLDLGGMAKGYASTEIARLLKERGIKSALLDLGGNVHVVGGKVDGSAWRIGVRNPLQPVGNPALVVDVKDCAVITSGNYERFKEVDGKKYSHFFDTKTGQSVMSDLLSVTVISSDGSLADGLATAFMITGVDKALAILRDMSNPPGVIFITQEGITATSNLRTVITRSLIPVTFAEVP
ncbi:MAG: FAD:protein FMN transferase [Synergistaceae bacterium]|nr:FAD:protein FMN transferase [Synergistaceae bacterium]